MSAGRRRLRGQLSHKRASPCARQPAGKAAHCLALPELQVLPRLPLPLARVCSVISLPDGPAWTTDLAVASPRWAALVSTIVVAATQAAKQTSALVPFCHQVPLTSVRVQVAASWDAANGAASTGQHITVLCTAATQAQTGEAPPCPSSVRQLEPHLARPLPLSHSQASRWRLSPVPVLAP